MRICARSESGDSSVQDFTDHGKLEHPDETDPTNLPKYL